MPKDVGGDAGMVVETGAVPPPPRSAGSAITFPSATEDAAATAGSGSSDDPKAKAAPEPASEPEPAFPPQPKTPSFQDAVSAVSAASPASPARPDPGPPTRTPAFAPPRSLSDVSFDEAKPSTSTFPGQSVPEFPGAAPEPKAPTFSAPKPLSEVSFDDAKPEAPRPAPPPMAGFQGLAAGGPAPQAAGASGMGISFAGASGRLDAPAPTPAQVAATSQSLRIRLLRPDGKPFDGPEITTGPKPPDAPQAPARTEFDTARKPKKQAPKVVVKSGPLERTGHALAVLLISAIGIVPLGYLMLRSVHDREDKLASTITVPTKMNVLDSTSEAYLGGMAGVLLVVTVLYLMRLKRRRAR